MTQPAVGDFVVIDHGSGCRVVRKRAGDDEPIAQTTDLPAAKALACRRAAGAPVWIHDLKSGAIEQYQCPPGGPQRRDVV